MRLLHTADWHLGHRIRDWDRSREHEAFLTWLLDTVERQRVDVLLVTGDVFDSVNPSAEAQRLFYSFLRHARRRQSALKMVVLGGNHDSAERLEAPRPLLDELGVEVVGALARSDGAVDADRHLLRLEDPRGQAVWIGCVPFLRPSDLPRISPDATPSGESDPLIEGVRAVYRELCTALERRRFAEEPVVWCGHLYLVGGLVSELSERRILSGHEHALPLDIFPRDAAYVALGHLHRPQAVGGAEHVRYAGSPLPLSITERDYRHQVCLVELGAGGLVAIEPEYVPRAVELLRIPARGALPIGEVEAALAELDRAGALPVWRWPFIDLHIAFDRPDPALLYRIEQALEDRAARLVRVARELPGTAVAPERFETRSLGELAPEEVLRRLHRERHGTEPSTRLLGAFEELVEAVQREGAP